MQLRKINRLLVFLKKKYVIDKCIKIILKNLPINMESILSFKPVIYTGKL